ncbi:MAG: helix-hairpin-helix domain-containing protein [Gammaproteobacteria bacterium]|jgi:competence protein ComEA|nr:helix-hairpin-helix domain-containing protein [Chromatiales bacterium]MDX5333075.1 helix-hairpin-helix domain-containing protein [Gammaproteobacteria bacterium]MDX5374729.1 helix-hairpin-helix domain-containing protein [Gammaproteobacteria bacterium]
MKHLIRSFVLSLLLLPVFALAGPVNINTADADTLTAELKGIGPQKAAAIVAHREQHGPFTSPYELTAVKGIGEKTVQQNLDNILIEDAR